MMQIDEIIPGLELGPSDWLDIPQSRIDAFAGATGDDQWIHVDPERAAAGPFGSTIAHGYLTLSLLAPFSYALLPVEAPMILNYGLDRVRFPSPVPCGSRVRARFKVASVAEIESGVQVHVEATIEIEGQDKPACVAVLIFRYLREASPARAG